MELESKRSGDSSWATASIPAQGGPPLRAHSITAVAVAETLASDPERGLSSKEASRRLGADGPNALKEEKPTTPWEVLAGQFASFLIAILIIAAIISLAVGEVADSIVIFAIVILNAALGTFQELRAERALEALMHSVAPTARVIREGIMREIPAADLVRGDLVVLHAGDLVPADLRLTESHSLSIDESPLTGESVPLKKSPDPRLEEKVSLGDRVNCTYMGTRISYGRGAGIVFATGMNTELGHIARMVSSQRRSETPLQQRLSELGKLLGIAALVVCAIIFLTGLLRGLALFEMFLVAVSLAVAAVPEGLPAVVTIALALGLQRMLKRNALVRRLAAVETLGAATVICTDKTGTLTRGAMEVERLYVAGDDYYVKNGTLMKEGKVTEIQAGSPLFTMLLGMALCNDAALEKKADGSLTLVGSPTELALALAAQEGGIGEKWTLEKHYPRIAESPFDSQRKRMSTAHKMPNGQTVVFAKGAPDVMLQFCTKIAVGKGIRGLDGAGREHVLAYAESLASQSYRLLAVAYREDSNLGTNVPASELERDLIFLGLAGLMDPPRPEAPVAVGKCTEAGIRTIMVTGDHGQTALTIARTVGIVGGDARFLAGPQVDETSREELGHALENTNVFARVSPHHKLRIVDALQERGEVVAMTGDGSNDAPALKKANIGIAMGIRGTDVSKEAADMVLTDDNFQSIVAAVHEGRVIYSNIRKVVMYLLSANIGEILAVFAAMVSGLPLLLQPIQILWLNLVTDGLPALALSVEREEPGIMSLPPRDPREGILTGHYITFLAILALVISGVTLTAFVITLRLFPQEPARAQTAAFVTLSLGEIFKAYAFRVQLVSVFRQGLFSNRSMVVATVVSATLLLVVVYLPALQGWFKTVTLGSSEWWYIAPLILVPFAAAEITSAVVRNLHTGLKG